jgi:hypothetical protein
MSCGLAVVPVYMEPLYDSVGRFADIEECRREGARNREYILFHHDAKKVAEKLGRVWRDNS